LEWALAAALFLTPLAMNPWGLSPGGPVKDAAMWAAAAVVGALLLHLWLLRSRMATVPRRLAGPAAFWILTLVVSTAVAVSRPAGAWAVLDVLPFAVVAVGAADVSRRTSGRRRLVGAWVASAGCVSAYALLQHFGLSLTPAADGQALQRATGTLGQPTYLAAFLAAALPFGFALLNRRRAARWASPCIVLILLALTASYSRAGWVAAAVGSLVAILAARGAWNRAGRRRIAVSLAAGLALGCALVMVDLQRPRQTHFERFGRFENGSDSNWNDRTRFWEVAGQAIRERPLLGWGPDGFRSAAPVVDRDWSNFVAPLSFPHPNVHNEFFTAALDGGLLGLVAWGLVVLGLASAASDAARRETGGGRVAMAGAYGSVVAFIVQGLATPRAPVTSLGLAVCWGVVAGTMARGAAAHGRRAPRPARAAAGALGAAAVAGALACAFLAVTLTAADVLSYQGVRDLRALRLDAALGRFQAAARWNPMEPDQRRLVGETAVRLARISRGSERVSAARAAEAAYRANSVAEPGNGFWRAGRAQSLIYLDLPSARAEMETAVTLYPLSAHIRYVDAVVCRAEGRPMAERAALDAATICGSVEPEPYIRLAEIFRAEGQPDKSESLLTYAADTWQSRKDLAPWRSARQARR
jgi:O-antigen ligase